MGKKRISTIDLTEEKKKGLLRGGRKDSSEVADKKKHDSSEAGRQKKVADKKKHDSSEVGRQRKRRSQRYQALRKLVKPDKLYPLPEAIDLLKKIANSKFDETIELHLVLREPGKMTEKKAPLAHLKIGKIKEDKKKLLLKIEKVLKPFDQPQIQKAVLTATMSPGIKLEIAS